MKWQGLRDALLDARCQGAGAIQIIGSEPFYEEDSLPFRFEGGGVVAHVIPDRGFRKEALAGSPDERLLIVDCPDDEGWLCPDDIVAEWMARNISVPALDDLLLSHPLYEYLTKPDEDGNSRGGARGELIQWAPGMATIASLSAPEFLPNDEEAPAINRDRTRYATAVLDLVERLENSFNLLEVEVGLRFGDQPLPDDDE